MSRILNFIKKTSKHVSQLSTKVQGEKKIGMGINNFRERLIKDYLYIDKTMFLKHFFSLPNFTMIMVPQRFGKSSILNLCDTCLSAEVDEKGNPLITDRSALLTRVMNEENENKLSGKEAFNVSHNLLLCKKYNLKIINEKKFVENHFGRYPIIFLNFREVSIMSEELFNSTLNRMISKAIERHEYLLKSEKLNCTDKEKFRRFVVDSVDPFRLKTLTEYLKLHFNENCIILIDEYDSLVDKLIFNRLNCIDSDRCFNYLGEIIGSLIKDNYSVERALILVRSAIRGILSPYANNIVYKHFLEDETLFLYFGLTGKEVEDLLNDFGLKNDLPLVKRWYNGYGKESFFGGVYNYWSVLNYLSTKQCRSYWARSAGVQNLSDIFAIESVQKKMREIVHSENVFSIPSKDDISVKDIQNLREVVHRGGGKYVDDTQADLFISYMYNQGYFNFVNKTEDFEPDMITLKVPNYEIKQHLIRLLDQILFQEIVNKIPKNIIQEYVNSILDLHPLTEEKVKHFGMCLLELFRDCDKPFPHEQCYTSIMAYSVRNVVKELEVFSPEQIKVIEGKGHSTKWIDTLLKLRNLVIIGENKRLHTSELAFNDLCQRRYFKIVEFGEHFGIENLILMGCNFNFDLKKKTILELKILSLKNSEIAKFEKEVQECFGKYKNYEDLSPKKRGEILFPTKNSIWNDRIMTMNLHL